MFWFLVSISVFEVIETMVLIPKILIKTEIKTMVSISRKCFSLWNFVVSIKN